MKQCCRNMVKSKMNHSPLGDLHGLWWWRYLSRNCHLLNITGLHWQFVNIGSGNGSVPSGTSHYPITQYWPRSVWQDEAPRPQWVRLTTWKQRELITKSQQKSQETHPHIINVMYRIAVIKLMRCVSSYYINQIREEIRKSTANSTDNHSEPTDKWSWLVFTDQCQTNLCNY